MPVSPAAHYHMGGIASDDYGRSSIPGLWCVGECASTGLHGANRLASNSLAEALVFGARVAADVSGSTIARSREGCAPAASPRAASTLPQAFRRAMSLLVGVERDEAELRDALGTIQKLERASGGDAASLNVLASAKLVAAAALQRRESIGAHFRRDFPQAPLNPGRGFLTLHEAETIAARCDDFVGRSRERKLQ
jgi:L-aspartate oxidase